MRQLERGENGDVDNADAASLQQQRVNRLAQTQAPAEDQQTQAAGRGAHEAKFERNARILGRVLEQKRDTEKQDQDADADENIAVGKIRLHRVADATQQDLDLIDRVGHARGRVELNRIRLSGDSCRGGRLYGSAAVDTGRFGFDAVLRQRGIAFVDNACRLVGCERYAFAWLVFTGNDRGPGFRRRDRRASLELADAGTQLIELRL